jgi:hypothetical protein
MVRDTYKNVLILRVRMPISDDLNPRNFITKISRYARVSYASPSIPSCESRVDACGVGLHR